MNSFLLFFFKFVKTIFYLPIIILEMIKDKISELLNPLFTEIKVRLKVLNDRISEYILNIANKLKRFFKFLFKLFLISCVVVLNSLLICIMVNSFLKIPSKINSELHFKFSDHNNFFLLSEMFYNCSQIESYEYCSSLDKATYEISLDLEIANKIYTENTENIEVEMKMHNNIGKSTIRRLFFFERYEGIIKLINNILLSPFRLLGFYTMRHAEIMLIDHYDNNLNPISKLDVIIKNKHMNINKGTLVFSPKIGFIKNILSLVKTFTLPALFYFCFFAQIIIYVALMIYYQKY
jgi:hypothetical protein